MKRALYGLLVIQLIFLSGLYAYHQSALSGTTYRIETQPVDPRDLFRGDYVVLKYPISQPDPKLLEPHNFGWKQDVYVVLREDEVSGFWVVESIHAEHPGSGKLVLKATWKRNWLDYGIGRYYVPEGMGNPAGKITVDIVVNRAGRAMIKQLYSGGQAWY